MKTCPACHDKDRKVTGCKLSRYTHHLIEWGKCEICGTWGPTSDCIHYGKLLYKKAGA